MKIQTLEQAEALHKELLAFYAKYVARAAKSVGGVYELSVNINERGNFVGLELKNGKIGRLRSLALKIDKLMPG